MLKDKNGNITHVESVKFDIKTVAVICAVIISILIAGFRLESKLETSQTLDHAAIVRLEKQIKTSSDTLGDKINTMHESIKNLDTDVKDLDNRIVRLETIVDQNLSFRKSHQDSK